MEHHTVTRAKSSDDFALTPPGQQQAMDSSFFPQSGDRWAAEILGRFEKEERQAKDAETVKILRQEVGHLQDEATVLRQQQDFLFQELRGMVARVADLEATQSLFKQWATTRIWEIETRRWRS